MIDMLKEIFEKLRNINTKKAKVISALFIY